MRHKISSSYFLAISSFSFKIQQLSVFKLVASSFKVDTSNKASSRRESFSEISSSFSLRILLTNRSLTRTSYKSSIVSVFNQVVSSSRKVFSVRAMFSWSSILASLSFSLKNVSFSVCNLVTIFFNSDT